MAKEWYLLKTPHNQVSGYETEAMDDFAQEGFLEAIDSGMGDDIEIYNYDLSECRKLRAIVQGTVQDTKLKTHNRLLYVPIGTCKTGMYVKHKRRFWLITGIVDDNKMYEKCVMIICNYKISWLSKDGKVCQRWANVASASQYNNGETGGNYLKLRSDQLFVSVPNDDESLLLSAGERFIIDKRCEVYQKRFGDDVTVDTSNPLITYVLARPDNVLYDYQSSGYYEFMVIEDEQQKGDGYYVIDGKGYWLCKPAFNTSNISPKSEIECNSLELYNGLGSSVFIAKFYDENGNIVDVAPNWEIKCDFLNQLKIEYRDNSIYISVDNNKLVGKKFTLSLSADGYETQSVEIVIKSFI